MRQTKSIKILFLVGSFLFLSSCNRIDLIYSWSENFLVYELDDYFDLTHKQKGQIKVKFKERLNLFLIDQEFEINRFIRDYQGMVQDREIEKLPEISKRGREWFSNFAVWFLPMTLEVVQELSTDQVAEFEKQFKKKIEKDAKRDEVKVIRDRLNRWMDWIGLRPTSVQKRLVQEFAEKKPFPFQLQREHSQKLFERFIEVYQAPDQRRVYLEQLFSKPESLRSKAYQEAMVIYQTAQYDLQKSLLRSLSEEQRKSIFRKIEDDRKTIQGIIDGAKKNSKE